MSSSPVPNEISAPYEVPHYPIEQIETKLAQQKHISQSYAKSEYDRRSEKTSPEEVDTATAEIDDYDYVPHFQRVSISGEDTSGVPAEDLRKASQLLVRALGIRERYMTQSHQSFPDTAARFLHSGTASSTVRHGVRTHIHEHSVHAPSTNNPWDVEWLPPLDCTCEMVNGVYQVKDADGKIKDYVYPVKEQFLADFTYLCTIIADGPLFVSCHPVT